MYKWLKFACTCEWSHNAKKIDLIQFSRHAWLTIECFFGKRKQFKFLLQLFKRRGNNVSTYNLNWHIIHQQWMIWSITTTCDVWHNKILVSKLVKILKYHNHVRSGSSTNIVLVIKTDFLLWHRQIFLLKSITLLEDSWTIFFILRE